jgi:hypothetical protein
MPGTALCWFCWIQSRHREGRWPSMDDCRAD